MVRYCLVGLGFIVADLFIVLYLDIDVLDYLGTIYPLLVSAAICLSVMPVPRNSLQGMATTSLHLLLSLHSHLACPSYRYSNL